jgi:hypothetical protein
MRRSKARCRIRDRPIIVFIYRTVETSPPYVVKDI